MTDEETAPAPPAEPSPDDTEPSPDDTEPSPDDTESSPRRPSPLALAVAAAVGFAVLAIVMTIIAVGAQGDDGVDDDRQQVALNAGRVAEAITTIGGDGSAQRATIDELATGPIVAQYNEAAGILTQTFAELNLTGARSEIREVYVGEIDDGEAQAIVVVDLILQGATEQVVPNHYLRVHLIEIDGVWKVDAVEDVNTALALSGTPPAGGSAPSTTVTPG